MRILVTGGAGQLARSLLQRGEARPGLDVVAVGRPRLDLEQPDGFETVLDEVRPDLVINAAAYTAVDAAEDDADRAFLVNGEASGQLAAEAARRELSFIQMSTDYVFSGHGPHGEGDAPAPLGVYGASKLAGEDAVRRAHPRALITRTAWVYSPWGRNFLSTMMRLGGERSELSVVADQLGSPTSAPDLAEALLSIAEIWRDQPDLGPGETIHLAGSGWTSWHEFAAAIMAERLRLGLPAAAVKPICTEDFPTRAVRPKDSRLLTDRAAALFEVRLPEWRESTIQCVRALAAHG